MKLECKFDDRSSFFYDSKMEAFKELEFSTFENLQKDLKIPLYVDDKFYKDIIFNNLPETARGVPRLTLKFKKNQDESVSIVQEWFNKKENYIIRNQYEDKKFPYSKILLSCLVIILISALFIIGYFMQQSDNWGFGEEKIVYEKEEVKIEEGEPDNNNFIEITEKEKINDTEEENESLKNINEKEEVITIDEESVGNEDESRILRDEFIKYIENNNLYFIKDTVILLAGQDEIIEKLGYYLNELKILSLTIEGHAASIGKPLKERSISKERALYVATILQNITNHKVNFIINHYGSSKPAVTNGLDDEEKQLNRRVEFKL